MTDTEQIKWIAKDRASHLSKVRTQYRQELEDALEQLSDAEAVYLSAKKAVAELRAKLAPLADEIAHLEACAESEAPTLEGLVWRGSEP